MGQGEWIAGNAGQGFLEALLGSSPLLILTEMSDGGPLSHHGYYQSGTGDYGSWDASSSLRGVTKRVMVSHDPAQAVQHTQLAFKHALAGEPGPVAVIYHGDALKGKVGPDSVPRIYPTRAYLPRPLHGGRRRRRSTAAAAALPARPAARRSSPATASGSARPATQLIALARALDAPGGDHRGRARGSSPRSTRSAAGVIGTFGMPDGQRRASARPTSCWRSGPSWRRSTPPTRAPP